MEEKRLRIGELLIEAGVLNHAKLREALDLQKSQRRPLGVILVESGFVTEAQLIQALSRQLSIPWVSLWHVDVAPELLAIVSREEAEKYHLLPIYARTVRGEKPALFVAMDDPTNQEALEFVREAAGMDVRPMIAAPTDLRQAIVVLYGGEEEEEEEPPPAPPAITPRRSAPPPPPPPPPRARSAAAPPEEALELTEPADGDEPPAETPGAAGRAGEERVASGAAPDAVAVPAAEGPVVAGGSVGAPPPTEQDLDEGVQAASEPPPPPGEEPSGLPAASSDDRGLPAPSFLVPGAIEGGAVVPAPAPPSPAPDLFAAQPHESSSRRKRRALALTFLDGTSIALGDGTAAGAERPSDLAGMIASLRRFAEDPSAPQPYGPAELSRIVAALLDVLSRKALLTAEEMAEAMRRRS
ncbi:MAG: hypothetical protein HY907_00025 [Deltaproteobacteria bacterium]|nr:hypothetical protein [Deltaproteobacteria bacterium]